MATIPRVVSTLMVFGALIACGDGGGPGPVSTDTPPLTDTTSPSDSDTDPGDSGEDTTAPPALSGGTLADSVVSWGAVSDPSGITNYKLYKYTAPSTYTLLDTLSGSGTNPGALIPTTIGTITSGAGCTGSDSAWSCSGISGDSGYARTVDSAFAACTQITGSGSISARVTDFNKITDNYPKAGVGFMSGAVGTGPMVAQMIFPEGTNSLDTEYRTATSAAGLQTGITTGQVIPTIARVDYDATTAIATMSYDQGSGAVTNATVSVPLPDLKYACLFLSSRSENLSVSFDQISVLSGAAVIPTWDLADYAGCSTGCTVVATATDGAANTSAYSATLTYTAGNGVPASGTRDPLEWPFADTSIWNMPIGDGAVYTAANISANPPGYVNGEYTNDPTYMEWVNYPANNPSNIVMVPSAPQMNIYYSSAGWSGSDRCVMTDGSIVHTNVPFPTDFFVASSDNDQGTSILLADSDTVLMIAPFAKCSGYAYGTSYNLKWLESIKGDGRAGAQGGSGLSTLGGDLRIGTGDFITGPAKHAIKISLGELHMSPCTNDAGELSNTSKDCGRWPAFYGEDYSYGEGDDMHPEGGQLKLGALLAMHPSVDCHGATLGLETQPGKWLCWTLQNYGAYTTDTSPAPVVVMYGEHSPTGDYVAAFNAHWGIDFEGRVRERNANPSNNPLVPATGNPWLRDVAKIIPLLHVVANNSATSVGGGGTPRQPLAPPFYE